jgi:hypothetical protein
MVKFSAAAMNLKYVHFGLTATRRSRRSSQHSRGSKGEREKSRLDHGDLVKCIKSKERREEVGIFIHARLGCVRVE